MFWAQIGTTKANSDYGYMYNYNVYTYALSLNWNILYYIVIRACKLIYHNKKRFICMIHKITWKSLEKLKLQQSFYNKNFLIK